MTILSVHNITFSYDQTVILKDISVAFEKGEKVAIIGQNGAGKTTLSKLLNGLLRPDQGSINLFGDDIREKPTSVIAKHVGYSFQNPDDQIFHDTVKKEIAFGPANLHFDTQHAKQAIDNAIRLSGLTEFLDTPPYNLPFSQRKFVTLASVIAMEPAIIILDEPTAGQDKAGIQQLEKMIHTLSDTTIIVVTHDMEFVARNFERILVMANGQILSDSGAKETFYNKSLMEKANIEQPYLMSVVEELLFQQDITTVDALRHRLKNGRIQQ